MPERIIYTRASRHDIRRIARMLPAILAGRAADPIGVARGFSLRLAVAFLSLVKLAFIIKMRGGTDAAGIRWKPLSKAYLAYGRRFGKGEKAGLKKAAGLGKGNRYSPGGKDGVLTKQQEARWWQVYKRNLGWLAAREGNLGSAKAAAASIAWATIKREGAKTKLEVFGNRQVEILRDTGVLFNSLSPGVLNEAGADASYSPPDGQVVRPSPGQMIVGTNVVYAMRNHRTRPLWPDGDKLPKEWLDDLADQASGGMADAVALLARGAA